MSQNPSGNSSCSLAKLQQLTNGLDMIPPASCNTMTPPPTAMTLTPPPTHHPHANMTPPPTHQMIQNQTVRNLASSPSGIPPNLQPSQVTYLLLFKKRRIILHFMSLCVISILLSPLNKCDDVLRSWATTSITRQI